MKIEEKEVAQKYNKMALAYHNLRTEKNDQGWFYNEMLEMPATLELLGDVKGKKILDFGCGSGIYAKLLTRKGARVKGFDISKEMLFIARKKNPKLDLKLGSGYKIPFKEKFDIVQASLVLDYFSNWDKVFKEIKRVLKKGGIFVFSIGNPICETIKKIECNGKKLKVLGIKDYFKEKKYYANWKYYDDNLEVKIPSYHKTYETIIKTIIKNNLEIIDYKDTFPSKKSKKLFPKDYASYSKTPYFCVWKVKKK
jgi:SAM-dependent methyltransferase